MKIKLLKIFFLFVSIFSIVSPSVSYALCNFDFRCIAADNLGFSQNLCVHANPEANGLSLINNEAPWVDSQFYTYGGVNTGDFYSSIKIYIRESWSPWSVGDLNTIPQCSYNNSQVCGTGGCINGDHVNDSFPQNFAPCRLSDGKGLYGLIAVEENGVAYSDPNDAANITSLGSSRFRTFHLGEGSLQNDAFGAYYNLTATEFCNELTGVCEQDTDPNGNPIIKPGRLFFKIQDRPGYYGDNMGGYDIQVNGAIRQQNDGAISQFITLFQTVLSDISVEFFETVVKDSQFLSITRSLLLLYIITLGVRFLLGLSKGVFLEVLVSSFKAAVIIALIAEDSWRFFYNDLFIVFPSFAEYVSQLLFQQIFYNNLDNFFARDLIQSDNIFTVFDNLYGIIFGNWSSKVWSYGVAMRSFIGIPMPAGEYIFSTVFLVIGIVWLILIVLKTMFNVIVSLFFLSFLLAIAPVFLVTILFSKTIGLFFDWLKQLISSAVLLIMTYAYMALMAPMVFGRFADLLRFTVCKDSGDWLYHRIDAEEVHAAFAFTHVAEFLIIVLLFLLLVNVLPKIADSLSNAARFPISSFADGVFVNFGRLRQRTTQFTLGQTGFALGTGAAGAVDVAKSVRSIFSGGAGGGVKPPGGDGGARNGQSGAGIGPGSGADAASASDLSAGNEELSARSQLSDDRSDNSDIPAVPDQPVEQGAQNADGGIADALGLNDPVVDPSAASGADAAGGGDDVGVGQHAVPDAGDVYREGGGVSASEASEQVGRGGIADAGSIDDSGHDAGAVNQDPGSVYGGGQIGHDVSSPAGPVQHQGGGAVDPQSGSNANSGPDVANRDGQAAAQQSSSEAVSRSGDEAFEGDKDKNS